MRCSKCDEYVPNDDPVYCPNCGCEFEEKSLADVDFPIHTQIEPRINVYRKLEDITGVDLPEYSEFTDDYPILLDVAIHKDGTLELLEQD